MSHTCPHAAPTSATPSSPALQDEHSTGGSACSARSTSSPRAGSRPAPFAALLPTQPAVLGTNPLRDPPLRLPLRRSLDRLLRGRSPRIARVHPQTPLPAQ